MPKIGNVRERKEILLLLQNLKGFRKTILKYCKYMRILHGHATNIDSSKEFSFAKTEHNRC